MVRHAYIHGRKELAVSGSQEQIQSISWWAQQYEIAVPGLKSTASNGEPTVDDPRNSLEYPDMVSMAMDDLWTEITERIEQPEALFIRNHGTAISAGLRRACLHHALHNNIDDDVAIWTASRVKKTGEPGRNLPAEEPEQPVSNASPDSRHIVITAEEAREAASILKKLAGIRVGTSSAESLAALIKLKNEKREMPDSAVILLDDAVADVQIERLGNISDQRLEELVGTVDHFLEQYSDPVHEIRDALEHAREKGAILLARSASETQGICIVVPSGFREFIPRYHLAYIGTKKGRKGRGIAGLLIDEAIGFSEGSLSLHVDIQNSRARKLYEKVGFHTSYYRMIYKPGLPGSQDVH